MESDHVIDQLIAQVAVDKSDRRVGSIWRQECAEQNHVLPVLVTWGGIYAITPTKEVMLFLEDTPDKPQPQSGHIVNVIRYQASKKFPELQYLKPEPGPNAQTCTMCNGTGTRPDQYSKWFDCKCGGLGWTEE